MRSLKIEIGVDFIKKSILDHYNESDLYNDILRVHKVKINMEMGSPITVLSTLKVRQYTWINF